MSMSNKASWVAVVALVMSLLSLLISASQYLQSQRPKLGFHSDSKPLSFTPKNESLECDLALTFQNRGSLECDRIEITLIAFTDSRKIGASRLSVANQVMPQDVFSFAFTVPLAKGEFVEKQSVGTIPSVDLFFVADFRYPRFPFGQYHQRFYLKLPKDYGVFRHCDLNDIPRIDALLAQSP
jgi:hypothetical protein